MKKEMQLRHESVSTDPTGLPDTRQEAKELKIPRFFTNVPCVNGHTVPRFTSSGACVVCARNNQRKWDARNIDKLRAYGTDYYSRNREQEIEKAREYRKINANKANAATRKWRTKNKDLVNAHGSRRRAQLLQACPSWVDVKELRKIYNRVKEITAKTGIKHHVDHIVPLKHDYVCGLHVPWNLQIIPAAENHRKKNKFDVGS